MRTYGRAGFACLTFAYQGQHANLTIRRSRGPTVWSRELRGPAPEGSGAFKHGLAWLYAQAEISDAPSIFNVRANTPQSKLLHINH